jgi:hypothetical protein
VVGREGVGCVVGWSVWCGLALLGFSLIVRLNNSNNNNNKKKNNNNNNNNTMEQSPS